MQILTVSCFFDR